MNKKGSELALNKIVGWTIALFALAVVITIVIMYSRPAMDFTCEKKYGGTCVETKVECERDSKMAVAGLGCANYCCLDANNYVN
ncbi:MAG TPA: hypothetical protein PLX15_03185 [Candidatus Woesearchaeota archaeon]|nr:hypothetical protein [Candidatus Woesearchaeota archaeon]